MKRKRKKNLKPAMVYVMILGGFLLLLVSYHIANNQETELQYDVGNPREGMQAPPMSLPSTDGTTFNLDDYEGEMVLLYFQEGIVCQACWVQLRDIETRFEEFTALGVDQVVTITTDPIGPLTEMVSINNFTTPVLSDHDVSVSSLYETNLYGMPGMGDNYNGHSFILVDGDGIIRWRADYGRYTMYVPVDTILQKISESLS